jgi:hypothetical protein
MDFVMNRRLCLPALIVATGLIPAPSAWGQSAETSASAPAWWKDSFNPNTPIKPAPDGSFVVSGRVSVDEKEAERDAQSRLTNVVVRWLEPDGVAADWTVPEGLIQGLIRDVHDQKVPSDPNNPSHQDYPEMVIRGYLVDLGPDQKAPFLDVWQREVVNQRLYQLAGLIAFVLVCLASLSGYIKADESTKGYFTNRLRLAAAAGVGAAGTAIYHLLS